MTTAHILSLSDSTQLLPDGSSIRYAENAEKIVLYHKPQSGHSITYVFNRLTKAIAVNGSPGDDNDKRKMVALGRYLLDHSSQAELVKLDLTEV